jgi:Ankyrin repeats (3 copies)
VKVFVECGAEIDKVETRMTPLFIATAEEHLEIVKVLIEHGAEIDKAETAGMILLFIAALYGHFDIMRKLLDCKAEVIDICYFRSSLLALVCKSSIVEAFDVATQLIRGVDLNEDSSLNIAIQCRCFFFLLVFSFSFFLFLSFSFSFSLSLSSFLFFIYCFLLYFFAFCFVFILSVFVCLSHKLFYHFNCCVNMVWLLVLSGATIGATVGNYVQMKAFTNLGPQVTSSGFLLTLKLPL